MTPGRAGRVAKYGAMRKDGRGEFYDHEEWNGRWILVRFVWSDVTPTSAHFEQGVLRGRRQDVGGQLDLERQARKVNR
jgi:hypothetical protein